MCDCVPFARRSATERSLSVFLAVRMPELLPSSRLLPVSVQYHRLQSLFDRQLRDLWHEWWLCHWRLQRQHVLDSLERQQLNDMVAPLRRAGRSGRPAVHTGTGRDSVGAAAESAGSPGPDASRNG